MRVKRYVLVLMTVLAVVGLRAQTEGDSLRVSLLTCAPGTEVYQLYGHTALRVQDEGRGVDAVFNYGVFDFRTPHFTWRFVLGECDYMVAAYPFSAFLQEYEERGSQVTEQVLALNADEKLRLFRNLATNAQPQNRTYRYNFLLNNCTTKARDMVEQAVDGRVVYPKQDEYPTYREMLHRYTRDYPWAETGNDLLLGAPCDTVLSARACQFLPERLMQDMEEAQIFDKDENRRPLVGETHIILPDAPEKRMKPAADSWQGRPLPAGCRPARDGGRMALAPHVVGRGCGADDGAGHRGHVGVLHAPVLAASDRRPELAGPGAEPPAARVHALGGALGASPSHVPLPLRQPAVADPVRAVHGLDSAEFLCPDVAFGTRFVNTFY